MEDQLDKGLEGMPPVEDTGSAGTPPEAGGGSLGSASVPETDADGLPTDNAARTSLGRKLTRYEQQMKEMSESLNRMNEMMMRQMEERSYTPPARHDAFTPAQDEPDDEVVVTTWKDVKRLQEAEERKKTEKQVAYQNQYIRHVKQRPFMVKDTPGDIHAEVEREMMGENARFYPIHTGDPRRDAEINYGLAKAKVLERKYSQAVQKPNVRGDRPTPPAGMTATTRTPAASVKPVQLDEYAEKFVRALGKSPDDPWVQNSLNRKED
jgi:TolA-binding protein